MLNIIFCIFSVFADIYIARIDSEFDLGVLVNKFSNSQTECVVKKHWEIGKFKGVLIDCEYESSLNSMINNHPEILQAERDTEVFTTNWGLDRINQRYLPLDNVMSSGEHLGQGVDVFILDTGVQVDHPEFEGRAKWGLNLVDNDDNDMFGHGTHVAGIVASKCCGIAPKANIIAVKVLGNDGSGQWSSVLSGIEYAYNEAKKSGKPSVVNLSLGSPIAFKAIDDAINAASELSNIQYVCAAGNWGVDACDFSPAGASSCFTVGATDIDDNFAFYSNNGACIDINAFGTDIVSLWPNNGMSMQSGTSMAAPQVAGAFARLLSSDLSVVKVKEKMLKDASTGVILNLPNMTTERLLYLESEYFGSKFCEIGWWCSFYFSEIVSKCVHPEVVDDQCLMYLERLYYMCFFYPNSNQYYEDDKTLICPVNCTAYITNMVDMGDLICGPPGVDSPLEKSAACISNVSSLVKCAHTYY